MTPSELPPIDTPALLIDLDVVDRNLERMQEKANNYGVALRPHIKTHKIPELAQLQMRIGARGITAAKVSEAEVMAAAGIKNIFIANQIVTKEKLHRLAALSKKVSISIGLDSVAAARKLSDVFAASGLTWEERSGTLSGCSYLALSQVHGHLHSCRSGLWCRFSPGGRGNQQV